MNTLKSTKKTDASPPSQDRLGAGGFGSVYRAVKEETGEVTGFDDVFSKLEKAREWYDECGLGREYADRLVR